MKQVLIIVSLDANLCEKCFYIHSLIILLSLSSSRSEFYASLPMRHFIERYNKSSEENVILDPTTENLIIKDLSLNSGEQKYNTWRWEKVYKWFLLRVKARDNCNQIIVIHYRILLPQGRQDPQHSFEEHKVKKRFSTAVTSSSCWILNKFIVVVLTFQQLK